MMSSKILLTARKKKPYSPIFPTPNSENVIMISRKLLRGWRGCDRATEAHGDCDKNCFLAGDNCYLHKIQVNLKI